ncbi:MAG TPA: ATP-binding protein [Polyangia bacterium]
MKSNERKPTGSPAFAPSPRAEAVPTAEEDDLPQLIARLAQAESALERTVRGRVDAAIHGAGYSYLLHEAQVALVHSEARAKEDAALLAAVLRSAPDLVTYVGADGIVRWTNTTVPGTPAEAVIGSHWLRFAVAERRSQLEAVFAQVLSTGEPASFDGPGPIGRGAIGWRSRRFGPVWRDGEVIGIVIVSRDVTDAKAAEVQLMVSDRMASLGALAAGMAHEINNPLAAAMGNVEVVRESLKELAGTSPPAAELVEMLDDVIEATGRIRFVVRDLKMFSRSSESDNSAVDVQRALDSALRMARNETRHRALVEVDYAHTRSVLANESRLGQVFLNLLVNAAQSLPEGNANGNRIRISTYDDDDETVTVRISDTGPGIPPEVQKHIFTPFFTTKPVGIGTGLGLSICHRIVAGFGGEMSFRSAPGKGTDFFVSLPVVEPSGPVEARVARPLPRATRRGRILVIDDDAMVGDSTANMLSREHDVVTVTGAAAALDTLRSGAKFDVILCDLMMPQMTGMDFFTALSSLDPGAMESVVFTTGGAFTPSARAFLKAVRNRFLEKPFDLITLRALVNEMVR